MIISEIYKKYRINKGLQEHMIRAGAIAHMLAEHSQLLIDRTVAVSACLLHDMGNLIKSTPQDLPELFEPEGVEYWCAVQKEMTVQYKDVETATMSIVEEINPLRAITHIVANTGLGSMEQIAASGTLEEKVLEYADMRIGLYGIVSMAKRFEDIRARYVPGQHTKEYIDSLEVAAKKIEAELFAGASINPEDITDESTEKIQAELYHFDIPTKP